MILITQFSSILNMKFSWPQHSTSAVESTSPFYFTDGDDLLSLSYLLYEDNVDSPPWKYILQNETRCCHRFPFHYTGAVKNITTGFLSLLYNAYGSSTTTADLWLEPSETLLDEPLPASSLALNSFLEIAWFLYQKEKEDSFRHPTKSVKNLY